MSQHVFISRPRNHQSARRLCTIRPLLCQGYLQVRACDDSVSRHGSGKISLIDITYSLVIGAVNHDPVRRNQPQPFGP